MKKARSVALPVDYEGNPERFRVSSALPWRYGAGDERDPVALRISDAELAPVLAVGCRDGQENPFGEGL